MSESNFIDFPFRRAMRPTARTWIKHSLLLLLTLFTATIAGVLEPFGPLRIFPEATLETGDEIWRFIFSLPYLYIELIIKTIYTLATNLEILTYGLKFSLSLLFILTCHEAGHYIACRIYGVDATLPYFLPTPPLIGPAGTLGAFIKILSPLPSRKATFDIGVAGPIAGFIAIIPIAFLMFFTLKQAQAPPGQEIIIREIIFSDPLFLKVFAYLFNQDLSLPIKPNPFYAAAWIGLLVTALNLIPSGQLDGGHAVYAVFDERIHYWTGRIAFVLMVFFSITGWYLYSSPSALLFTILLGIMMRIRHPEPLDNSPLDFKRKVVAFLTLLIFILCFTPFPIQVR
jgi:membrane-associated protease RseP (regulator of RpoE activity)